MVNFNHPRFDRIIFSGIIVLLIFAPLAFGSVHVWAYSVVEFGVFSLLLLWFADQLIFSGSKPLVWVKTPVNLILLLFLALIGLQLIPLPAPVGAVVSPKVHADKTQLFKIMAEAADVSPFMPSRIMLSHSLHPTLRAAWKGP